MRWAAKGEKSLHPWMQQLNESCGDVKVGGDGSAVLSPSALGAGRGSLEVGGVQPAMGCVMVGVCPEEAASLGEASWAGLRSPKVEARTCK